MEVVVVVEGVVVEVVEVVVSGWTGRGEARALAINGARARTGDRRKHLLDKGGGERVF